MGKVQTILKESRVYYDKDGECWISLHVPREVDVGDMGEILWQNYVRYLRGLNVKPDAVQDEPCLV